MMLTSGPLRILVTRTDRLGDVLLATPVLKALKNAHPNAKITFLVQAHWLPVLQYGDAIELMTYDPNESISDLASRLRAKQFHRAYVIRDEKKISRAVKKAGIPDRTGPYSSLRSFFLFNRGILQKRSRCRLHESEYNLELVSQKAFSKSVAELPRAWVETNAQAKQNAAEFLKKHALEPREFYVLHPGSSGSARYVKADRLYVLAQALIKRGSRVVISGGPAEDAIVDEFQKAVPGVILLAKNQAIGLDGMAEVYRQARAVIAHGTGPLHLAAAVGTPVLAIFPPIFVLSEKRWGPLVSARSVWTPPDVDCPAIYRCIGEKCRYYDCMDRFEINEALARLESITATHEAKASTRIDS